MDNNDNEENFVDEDDDFPEYANEANKDLNEKVIQFIYLQDKTKKKNY